MAGVPPVPTFTASEILTSADVNRLAVALNFAITNRPVCKAHQTIVQTLSNITYTVLSLDTTDVDTDGGRSGTGAGTDRYVCRTQGWYAFAATAGFQPSSTAGTFGERIALVSVNGGYANGASTMTANDNNTCTTLSGLVHMNVNDYFQLSAYQSTGGSLVTAITPAYQASEFSLYFVLGG